VILTDATAAGFRTAWNLGDRVKIIGGILRRRSQRPDQPVRRRAGAAGRPPWHYALIGESLFHVWRGKGARLGDLLEFSRVRSSLPAEAQQDLDLAD
jgi:hypothetical protein